MKYIVNDVEKTWRELNDMLLNPSYEMYCFEIIKVEADKIYIQAYKYDSYC